MKTKLVYVLTCAPEAMYIEQALMAVWTARHHNPWAHIVLLTDDKTSAILHTDSQRGEILQYITEEIVTSFDEDRPMHYRSRWLKTKVRELVEGNLLFIDCDTICQHPLSEIDQCSFEIAMVPDEHMCVSDYPKDLKDYMSKNSEKLGYDVLVEKWYFNSGVIYAKDSDNVHALWSKWHECWIEGEKVGVGIDQTALGKANLQMEHPIQCLDDVWNTLIYMSPIFAKDGKILHFWNFRNKSFIFCKPFLLYVRQHGLDEYVKDCILHPLKSVLPFKNEMSSYNIFDYLHEWRRIRLEKKKYAKYVDSSFSDFPWNSKFSLIKYFVKIKVLNKKNSQIVYYS